MISPQTFAIKLEEFEDADKLMGIIEKLGATSHMRQLVHDVVLLHKAEQVKRSAPIIPYITLNEMYLGACIVPEKDIDDMAILHEYAVPAYAILQRIAN
jgi:hypothetical protein